MGLTVIAIRENNGQIRAHIYIRRYTHEKTAKKKKTKRGREGKEKERDMGFRGDVICAKES